MPFLARRARRFSKNKTAQAFRTSSEMVFDDIEHPVALGSRTPNRGRIIVTLQYLPRV